MSSRVRAKIAQILNLLADLLETGGIDIQEYYIGRALRRIGPVLKVYELLLRRGLKPELLRYERESFDYFILRYPDPELLHRIIIIPSKKVAVVFLEPRVLRDVIELFRKLGYDVVVGTVEPYHGKLS